MALSGLAPFFALPHGGRLGGGVVILAALVMVAATVVAMILPSYSASDPQQVNLYHFEDRDAGSAHWVGHARLGTMPELLLDRFDPEPVPVFPWMPASRIMVAEAEGTGLPAPGLEVLSDTIEGGQRLVEVQLRSPRGADGISLHVPADALAGDSVSAVTISGYPFAVVAEDAVQGYYSLDCFGRGCDGLVVELRLASEARVEVLVVDNTSGLPAGGEAWLQARPDTAVPVDEGDLTLLMKRVDL